MLDGDVASLGQLMLARDAAYLRMRHLVPSLGSPGPTALVDERQREAVADYERLDQAVRLRRHAHAA